MLLFRYLCLDSNGRQVRGELEAADISACRLALKNRGFLPIQITPAEALRHRTLWRHSRPPSAEKIVASLRQLASLISNHIPVLEAVETVAVQEKDPVLTKTFRSLADSLRRGLLFSEALRREGIFPEVLSELVSVAEVSGTLGITLTEFVRFQEQSLALRRRISTSLIYPLFLAGFSVLSLLFLFLVVMPKVTTVFVESGVALPVFTRIMMGIVSFLRGRGLLLLLVFIGALWGWWRSQPPRWKQEFQWKILRHLPFAARLTHQYNLVLFTRNLSVLHQAGVRMIDALQLVGRLLADTNFRQETARIEADLHKGASLSQALSRSALFPAYLVQMVRVGEETGRLGPMLERVAAGYAEELEISLTRFVALLEPSLIVVMGLLVATVVISVLLPIFEMSQIIK